MKLSNFLILSAVLLITSSLFAQEKMKKELGICGKTMSAVFKIGPNIDPQIASAFKLEDEFCDYGRYEENANFILYLYDSTGKLVYDKQVYLNPVNLIEQDDPKKPGELALKKRELAPTSRIVKFPLTASMGKVSSYKIESIKDKKTTDKKTINW